MSGTYRNTSQYLARRVGSEPNPICDVLALAMGEDLQVDLVEGSEAKRYAFKRAACEVCLSTITPSSDGPVVALILSALRVADEVGCGPLEALDILDGAECRVVCGLRQFLPTQRLGSIRSERDDRLAELLGVIVERTDEAAAFLQEQMVAKLRRYAGLRDSALEGADSTTRDDLQEKGDARLNAHRMAEDVSAMYRGLEAKLDYLREAAWAA